MPQFEIECPVCSCPLVVPHENVGKQGSCPECQALFVVPMEAKLAGSLSRNALCCAKCRSGEIQKLSVIYEGGTVSGSVRATTLGGFGNFADGFTPIGAATNVAISQSSILARRCQPPSCPSLVRQNLTYHIIAISIGAFLLIFFRFGAEFVVFGAALIYMTLLHMCVDPGGNERKQTYRRQLANYERATQEWRSGFFCHRCGHIGVPRKK